MAGGVVGSARTAPGAPKKGTFFLSLPCAVTWPCFILALTLLSCPPPCPPLPPDRQVLKRLESEKQGLESEKQDLESERQALSKQLAVNDRSSHAGRRGRAHMERQLAIETAEDRRLRSIAQSQRSRLRELRSEVDQSLLVNSDEDASSYAHEMCEHHKSKEAASIVPLPVNGRDRATLVDWLNMIAPQMTPNRWWSSMAVVACLLTTLAPVSLSKGPLQLS